MDWSLISNERFELGVWSEFGGVFGFGGFCEVEILDLRYFGAELWIG